jgi:hypothetical protein
LKEYLLYFFDGHVLSRALQTCKTWYSLGNNEKIWRTAWNNYFNRFVLSVKNTFESWFWYSFDFDLATVTLLSFKILSSKFLFITCLCIQIVKNWKTTNSLLMVSHSFTFSVFHVRSFTFFVVSWPLCVSSCWLLYFPFIHSFSLIIDSVLQVDPSLSFRKLFLLAVCFQRVEAYQYSDQLFLWMSSIYFCSFTVLV